MKYAGLDCRSLTLAAAGGWLAATMFAQPATGRGTALFRNWTMDELSDAQKAARRTGDEGLERPASQGRTTR